MLNRNSALFSYFQREIKALLSIAMTVCLPWLIAVFMVGPVAQFFQYVFIIVTAMQGPLCFICFVIFQEDVLTNLFKLVGSTPPAFLMAPKSSKSSKSTGAGAASESSHVPPTTVAHTKKVRFSSDPLHHTGKSYGSKLFS